MKTLTVRQMRSALSRLDEVIAEEGELVITRRGRPLARVLPLRSHGAFPSRAELRSRMPRLSVPSETLLRAERDAR